MGRPRDLPERHRGRSTLRELQASQALLAKPLPGLWAAGLPPDRKATPLAPQCCVFGPVCEDSTSSPAYGDLSGMWSNFQGQATRRQDLFAGLPSEGVPAACYG